MRDDEWNAAREQIMEGTKRLFEGVGRAERQAQRAMTAGDDLARVVAMYCVKPQGVGTDELQAALHTFRQLEAGNFSHIGQGDPAPEDSAPRGDGRDLESDRPHIYVHTDHNADEIRSFYEIPDSIARRVQPEGERRTFAQCLADLVPAGQSERKD